MKNYLDFLAMHAMDGKDSGVSSISRLHAPTPCLLLCLMSVENAKAEMVEG